MSQLQLAKRAGVSVSSVTRYRPVKPDASGPVTGPVNGNAPDLTSDTQPDTTPADGTPVPDLAAAATGS